MRTPITDIRIFRERRELLKNCLGGHGLILASTPVAARNHDVDHAFRQDSNLFYLTGFEEPQSVFVYRPGQNPETVMFVRRRDPEREQWEGFRFGPEGVETSFAIDKAYPLDEMDKVLPRLLQPLEGIYYRLFNDPATDATIGRSLQKTRALMGRTGRGLLPILDPTEILGEFRVKKSPYEISLLRKACQISGDAHQQAMDAAYPGVSERELHAVLNYHFLKNGCAREGYNSIVAGGANATILHYVFNDQICKDGDLVLIDAGGEYHYYSADITRTFPVNGRFSPEQRDVYQQVLDVQKSVIEKVHPGLAFEELQQHTIRGLSEALKELGVLSQNLDEIIENKLYKPYYPHGVSHFLGMDVHDAGLYYLDGKSRPLEPSMVFTVEPGLYFMADDENVPEPLRGIGVRIEDDVLVTDIGGEVLTGSAPKEIADLEK